MMSPKPTKPTLHVLKQLCIQGMLLVNLFAATVSFGQGTTQMGGDATPKAPLLPHSPEAESLGKFGDIPVGLYTGVPSISIPIYEMKLKNVTIPISLNYHSSGVKVDELASNVGLDWALNAGGVINIIQYGLSDFGGWLNPAPNFSTPQTAIPEENWSGITGWDTNNNYLFLKYAAEGQLDTQPDLYAFSFLGRSGKFFFDQSGGVHLMPYQNIKVDYTLDNNNVATVFTLTDEHGTKFYFGSMEATITITNSCNPGPGTTTNDVSRSYYLSKITTSNGEEVDFSYGAVGYSINNPNSETRYLRTDLGAPQYSACPDIPNCVSTSSSLVSALRLTNITNPNTGEQIVFTYTTNRTDLPGTQMLDQIEVFNGGGTPIKNFNLSHSYFYSAATNSPNSGDYRLQLTSVQESGKQPYLLYYNPITIPSRFSFNQDHWGYYNGPKGNTTLLPVDTLNGYITGADRSPDTTNMKAGVLNKIVYPTGGATDLIYESNDSYQVYDQATVQNAGYGGAAIANQTVNQTFTIPTNSAHFQASWVTTNGNGNEGSLNANGNNTTIILTGPNGYYQNFTGNSNGLVNYDYTPTITFPPGNYTLTITNTTDSTQAVGSFILYWQTSGIQHIQRNEFAGGLRIKSLVDYPVTGAAKAKYFEYTDVNDPTKSSGVLMYQPSYIFPYNKYSVSTSSYVTQCTYLEQQASSLAPLGTIDGGNVIYSNVIVYDGAKTNGYTSNEFVTNGNSYGQSFTATFPFPPLTNFDWLNGLPVKTTQFKYNPATNTYFPLSINQKTYKMAAGVGPNETMVRGMKISYLYPEFAGNIGYSPSNFQGSLPGQFEIGYYYLYSSWFHLDQEQTTMYDQNGQNPVISTTNYYYDNPLHIQLTRNVTTKSDGKILTQVTTYPDDYAAGTMFLDNMKVNHVVASPVEQASFQFDGTNTNILSGLIIHYQANGLVLPDTVYKLETTSPILLSGFKFSNATTGNFSFGNAPGTYSFDSRYKQHLVFNQYDNFGNPLMCTQTNAPPVSYQWGYNHTYLVAQATNAAVNDIFFDSFEEGDGSTSDPKTGLYSYSGVYMKSLSNLDNGTYTLSYWSKANGTWTYIENNNVAVTGGSYTISLPYGQYDDIRFYPSGAQMTTFTYTPQVGITSITDPKGQITYFEYDTLNRLMNIKDKDGNIIKHTDYHYQGQ